MPPRRTNVKSKPQSSGLPTWVIAVGIGAVVVLAAVGLFILQTPSAQVTTPRESSGLTSRTMGDPAAKLELVEYSDFQWPYCKDFALGAERQLEKDYFKAGKVKFTYRYYPVVDQGKVGESHWAAYAAECANKQGKFWEYHDKLFGEWRGENIGTFAKPNLKKFAADIGLNTTAFNQCVDNNETVSIVDTEYNQAQAMGISGTPTFLINGRALQVRTLDVSEFSRTFDVLLK